MTLSIYLYCDYLQQRKGHLAYDTDYGLILVKYGEYGHLEPAKVVARHPEIDLCMWLSNAPKSTGVEGVQEWEALAVGEPV